MTELDAFRSVDFQWVRQLKSVWRDPPYHVSSVHDHVVDDVIDYFLRSTRDPDPIDEPLGRVIVGPAGYGKTHLIGELRRRVWREGGWFVLLDLVGIKDFWSSVALGFLNSLQVRNATGGMQYDRLLLGLANRLGIDRELAKSAERWQGKPHELMDDLVQLFTTALDHKFERTVTSHRDVVTALVLLISEDLDCHSVAHAWLQGMNLDAEIARPLGFREVNSPIKVVRGLSWLMSLVGPTLIAVDQIDAIVTASNSRARLDLGEDDQQQHEAQSIVDALAQGLIDLHEVKRRAVTVISSLETTWQVLSEKTSIPIDDRYLFPIGLDALPNPDAARSLVAARLEDAYRDLGFAPPYETWPFAPSAFDTVMGLSPRELLKACERHRASCVARGVVDECTTFGSSPGKDTQFNLDPRLEQDFTRFKTTSDIARLIGSDGEDNLRELLDIMLPLFVRHLDLPDDIDATVQRDTDQRRPSLHGRLSFTFRREGDREQHFCFRILGHAHAVAFQSRLRAAMTASGVDRALQFRHLFILRRDEPPGGPKTKALVDQFLKAGGKFIAPSEDDLRTFVALRELASRDPDGFDAWLRSRRPLFDTAFFKAAGLCPPRFLEPPPSVERPGRTATPQDPASPKAAPPSGHRDIPVGRRYERGTEGEALAMSADLLPRHVAILAGSGSGKTVLLRRLIEEAALLGVPAIVLDPNNDLSRLGDAWPDIPNGFTSEDTAKASDYRDRAEVVIWTPGRNSGNPISLKLLPDFSAISDDQDEVEQAVEMAKATLLPFVGASGASGKLKQGVLTAALRRFAEKDGSALIDLIRLLEELPEDVSQVRKADKLAADMADQLHAATESNPLLRSGATSLDPAALFESPNGKTRISVINLSGLASEAARDAFVNQLQMTLFTWIKRNPSQTGRLYVLDEAQNFVPSQGGTACKASALSLAAQARKYGLGMMLATQTPKGIDNKIVSNCTTHFYGRMSSPATIDATRELMAAKGGAAEDIGRLQRGEFYFSTEGFARPVKVRTPLCLSFHPANPPTAEEIVEKARAHAK